MERSTWKAEELYIGKRMGGTRNPVTGRAEALEDLANQIEWEYRHTQFGADASEALDRLVQEAGRMLDSADELERATKGEQG